MSGRKGWYKVMNSPAFKPFMETYLLPTAVDKAATAKEFSLWGQDFKGHLKNAAHSYFNHHCGIQANQGEWVEKRWELRKKLLHSHMVPFISAMISSNISVVFVVADRNGRGEGCR